jgi:hypothetical protein
MHLAIGMLVRDGIIDLTIFQAFNQFSELNKFMTVALVVFACQLVFIVNFLFYLKGKRLPREIHIRPTL